MHAVVQGMLVADIAPDVMTYKLLATQALVDGDVAAADQARSDACARYSDDEVVQIDKVLSLSAAEIWTYRAKASTACMPYDKGDLLSLKIICTGLFLTHAHTVVVVKADHLIRGWRLEMVRTLTLLVGGPAVG
jgi:hypothetical protein